MHPGGDGEWLEVAGIQADFVDTTGADDAIAAVFIVALADRKSLARALAEANAYAAGTAGYLGPCPPVGAGN